MIYTVFGSISRRCWRLRDAFLNGFGTIGKCVDKSLDSRCSKVAFVDRKSAGIECRIINKYCETDYGMRSITLN